MRVVVLTGASGSGKSTIAKAIRATCFDSVDVYHFDAVGVPSSDAMIAGWGSVEEWQRATTFAWLKRIAVERDRRIYPVLLEGQMRISFIHEGLHAAGLTGSRVVLVDCDDESRMHRLVHERRQPTLANIEMMRWASYLRDEAHAMDVEVLDTTRMPAVECVRMISAWLAVSDESAGL